MTTPHTDLLIVGAGPTGLAAGCDALRHGLSVRLVERKQQRGLESKALVVHARTMEIFERLGCAEQVLASGQRFRALNVRPSPSQAPVRVDLLERPWGDTRYPFWLSVPQYDVERALEARFLELGGAIEWGVSVEDVTQDAEGVDAKLSSGAHRAQWLLACDGGRSTVREKVGLTLPRVGLGVTFALTDVWMDSGLVEDEGHAVLSPDGVLLVVPMPAARQWRLIAQVPGDFDATSLAAWQALLHARGGFGATLERLGWSSRFDLTGGVAPRFRSGRVFLLGDAAHVHSPVGGQGLNTGAQDAHGLVWRLALARELEATAREALLDSYDAERRPVAEEMVRMTTLATRVLTLKNPVARAVRGAVGRMVVSSARFQDQLSRRVGMLDLRAEGMPRLENPVVGPGGRRLHDRLHPLKPTALRWQGAIQLVRPDGIVARPGLVPPSVAVPVEVA